MANVNHPMPAEKDLQKVKTYTVDQLENHLVAFKEDYYEACSLCDGTPEQFLRWLKKKEGS